ncbi:lipoprotein [Xanthomonas sp. NCPPB 1067]|uniref:Type IV secretion system putative lipoprotein virB7 n=1 Tax=Xanthomonas melonis TaxID=56456 RepID=A0A2S7DL71_9XANT|nr:MULTISPECIES: lipoprotein [Xanthomonas]MCC4587071.1 lipoprotein [Xanthomonas sp. NCPPB 1067]MCC4601468.1 lipoprotein [Xanthomonas melonis]PPU74543.1 UDP-N-acetylglucosamine acyltransferase [Xanthomonas melonis]
MKKLLLAAVAVLALAGCASNPPMNFSVPNVGVASKKVDAELKSLTVTLARPDEKTGELPAWAEGQIPTLWQSALVEAVNRMVIFRDDAPRKVSLSVKVLKLDVPSFGASMTTDSAARYELIDRETGAIIYTQDIAASGTVPAGYAFAGVIRARESVNRSVQNNIAQFLQALETVDASKPMFPAAKGAGQ